jgi:transcription elongation factor B subunit 1
MTTHHPSSLLPGTFTETELGEIKFPEISSSVLEIVCRYFYYKLRYQNATTKNIPEFPVAPEMALELLMAANFLDA